MVLQAGFFCVLLPLLYLIFATILWIWYFSTKDEHTITPITILIGVGVFAPMILPNLLLGQVLISMWYVTQNEIPAQQ